jgi:hypothetical protein
MLKHNRRDVPVERDRLVIGREHIPAPQRTQRQQE